MYLGIRTDSPTAEFYLYEGTELRAEESWKADRQLAYGLLSKLEDFLAEHKSSFSDLSGLFVYHGPGSFTGLRIGITVANTIAYAQSIQIVGCGDDSWRETAVQRLKNGESDDAVLPFYGAEARITKPKK